MSLYKCYITILYIFHHHSRHVALLFYISFIVDEDDDVLATFLIIYILLCRDPAAIRETIIILYITALNHIGVVRVICDIVKKYYKKKIVSP